MRPAVPVSGSWLDKAFVGCSFCAHLSASMCQLLHGSIKCMLFLALPLHCCRLQKERQAAGITSGLTVSLVSRGPILQGLTPYARRTFLPLLKVSREGLVCEFAV